ncbi:MAG: RlmE family RNA methyltransferase [Planctomycetes bacterium]|nr:RlmE family RNA methyltransferase [Planctomycetota bacterium]
MKKKSGGNQHQDYYARLAKKEKYPARSIYKLEAIDKQFRILPKGVRVVDFGCNPGSWTLYSAQRVGESGFVLGIDINDAGTAFPGNAKFIRRDIFEIGPEELLSHGGKFDVVLSDMAPSTTGDRTGDHFRSMKLCHRVLDLAESVLTNGGYMVIKAFQGPDYPDLLQAVRSVFGKVKCQKPPASKSNSVEMFIVGIDYRPHDENREPGNESIRSTPLN